jgi:hypothetical protein
VGSVVGRGGSQEQYNLLLVVIVEGVGRFARVVEGRVKLMAGLSIHCGLGVAVSIIVSLTNCSLNTCLFQS